MTDGSGAEVAGLRRRRHPSIDGKEVKAAEDVCRRVSTHKPGDEIKVTTGGRDETRRSPIKLGERPVTPVTPRSKAQDMVHLPEELEEPHRPRGTCASSTSVPWPPTGRCRACSATGGHRRVPPAGAGPAPAAAAARPAVPPQPRAGGPRRRAGGAHPRLGARRRRRVTRSGSGVRAGGKALQVMDKRPYFPFVYLGMSGGVKFVPRPRCMSSCPLLRCARVARVRQTDAVGAEAGGAARSPLSCWAGPSVRRELPGRWRACGRICRSPSGRPCSASSRPTAGTVRGSAAQTNVQIDVTRVASNIVTGIGFLGGGAILKDGATVRGLTTAASLWVTAAVGLALALGGYSLAAVTTIGLVFSLILLRGPRGGSAAVSRSPTSRWRSCCTPAPTRRR